MAQQATNGFVRTGPAEKEWGKTEDVAEIFNVSASFLNKARLTGEDGPPYVKFGAAVRYHLPTVQQWALARAQQSTSASARAA